MSQVLRFFPRQAFPGAAGISIYSEIFEIPDNAQVVAELRCYAISGAATSGVSAFIQDCMNQQLDSWRDVYSAHVSAVAQGSMIVASSLCRFVRAKIIPAVSAAIVSFEGMSRDAT